MTIRDGICLRIDIFKLCRSSLGLCTECSLNIVFFSKNFQYFAFSPSPALGCYWLERKWPANRRDCTLRFQIRCVALLQAGGGLQWIGKKTQFWMSTLYLVAVKKLSFFLSESEYGAWDRRVRVRKYNFLTTLGVSWYFSDLILILSLFSKDWKKWQFFYMSYLQSFLEFICLQWATAVSSLLS